MKKTCPDHQRFRNSKSSLSTRLAAYSATAGAALLAAPSANATIQNITSFSTDYGASFTATAPSHGGGGNLVFTMQGSSNHRFRLPGSLGVFITASPGTHITNAFLGLQSVATNGGIVQKLALGAAVAGNPVQGGAVLANRTTRGTSHQHGGLFYPPAGTGYVGFKAQEHGQTYYGWLRVKVTFAATLNITFEAEPGAPGVFGAVGLPGDAITAGELATPEPGTLAIGGLGLLALGARGLRELRRRRETAAKN